MVVVEEFNLVLLLMVVKDGADWGRECLETKEDVVPGVPKAATLSTLLDAARRKVMRVPC